jgi:hypothetical protein
MITAAFLGDALKNGVFSGRWSQSSGRPAPYFAVVDLI